MARLKQFLRTELLLGKEAMVKLQNSKVAIFGAGGVGSYVVEALARSGVGHLILVDFDTICESNINRQIEALYSTLGRVKIEVLKERILDINPQAKVELYQEFINDDNIDSIIDKECSYLVDAIDNVPGKLAIIEKALQLERPVISAMGTGNKLDPSKLLVADISETKGCPLARVVRRELKKRGIYKGVKVVYSSEPPIPVPASDEENKRIIGSVSFVPSVAGLMIAAQVVRELV